VGAENTGLLSAGQHGTTFGGNPIACAAALAVLTTIETEGLIDHARRLGEQLTTELATIPGIAEVTGQGLLLGLRLAGDNPDAKAVAKRALEAGFIVNPVTPERLRLAP
ncbi:aminotransferase class III-fold pyridoxal phosphate-dependent enzyme, partial [Brevibacterium casei]